MGHLSGKMQSWADNNVEIEFSIKHLSIYINGAGFRDDMRVNDNYANDDRTYRLRNEEKLDKMIEKEKTLAEVAELAKELESQEKVNGWTRVEGDKNTFLKFVNLTKSVDLKLSYNDVWTLNGRRKSDIKEARYDMAKELMDRDPLTELLNEAVKEKLIIFLQNVDGVGETIAKKMVRTAISKANGRIESLDDIYFTRPKHVQYNITDKVESYFDRLDFDPVERAVKEKKKELVQEEGETQIIAEAI